MGSNYEADAPAWSLQTIAEQLTRIGDNLENLIELKQTSKVPPELLEFLSAVQERMGLTEEQQAHRREEELKALNELQKWMGK